MDEVFAELGVILAHCVSDSVGAGNPIAAGLTVRQKIERVIQDRPGICCSTIAVGDTISDSHEGPYNFFGPIGIILKKALIVAADPLDAGSSVNEDGSRRSNTGSGVPTADEIRNAIGNREPRVWNELIATEYEVFGIFICQDAPYWTNRSINNGYASVEEFYQLLSPLVDRFFTLIRGELFRAEFAEGQFNRGEVFDAREIYE